MPMHSSFPPMWAEYDLSGTFGVLAFICQHSDLAVDQYQEIEMAGRKAAMAGKRLSDCPYTHKAEAIATEASLNVLNHNMRRDGQAIRPIYIWAWAWADARLDSQIERRRV